MNPGNPNCSYVDDKMIDRVRDYITDNFTLSGEAGRLVCNTLLYAKRQDMDRDDFAEFLLFMFDAIGFEESDIEFLNL